MCKVISVNDIIFFMPINIEVREEKMDPVFQIKFRAMFPDINPAESEACSALGRGDYEYPLNSIWGGNPESRSYQAFKAKVKIFDPKIADLLDEVEKKRR
jgi:hypothetical protein